MLVIEGTDSSGETHPDGITDMTDQSSVRNVLNPVTGD